jgi:hypothetical protein
MIWWLWGILAGMGVAAYFVSEAFKTFLWWFISISWFIFVNVLFIYFWYWIGKWIYYIVINAKAFVQKSVNWVLTVFE